jgi:hypothetical protein
VFSAPCGACVTFSLTGPSAALYTPLFFNEIGNLVPVGSKKSMVHTEGTP